MYLRKCILNRSCNFKDRTNVRFSWAVIFLSRLAFDLIRVAYIMSAFLHKDTQKNLIEIIH